MIQQNSLQKSFFLEATNDDDEVTTDAEFEQMPPTTEKLGASTPTDTTGCVHVVEWRPWLKSRNTLAEEIEELGHLKTVSEHLPIEVLWLPSLLKEALDHICQKMFFQGNEMLTRNYLIFFIGSDSRLENGLGRSE